jgi:hypothetical protein
MKTLAPLKSLSAAEARAEHARLGEEITAHDRRYYQEDARIFINGRDNGFVTCFRCGVCE